MGWFKNRSIMQKLMIGSLLTCSMLGIVGMRGLNEMSQTGAMLDRLYENDLDGMFDVVQINIHMANMEEEVRGALVASDGAGMDAFVRKYDDQSKEVLALARHMLNQEDDEAIRDSLLAIESQLQSFSDQGSKMLRSLKSGHHDGLDMQEVQFEQVGIGLANLIEQMATQRQQEGHQAYDDSHVAYKTARAELMMLVGFGLLMTGLISLIIARQVSRPVQEAVGMLKDIAEGEGDLTRRMTVNSRDEVGEMARWFNTFIGKMHDIISQIRANANSVASSARELSSASGSISASVQEQASNLEETAASLEEMTATVQQNAGNARQANKLASEASGVAENGGQVVQSAVEAMGDVNSASGRIADITTAIDELAFQTNLLALNAAVEAARAGEQGRGFAVVAGEVRNLAQRSASSAKEIKGLIQDTLGKVKNGTELVNRSGVSLQEITVSGKQVADIVAEIAAASQEQATGIEQVNKAVVRMDQMTQSSAAQTEELTGTAESLASQASQLLAMVGRFKLSERFSPMDPAPRPAPTTRPAAAAVAPVLPQTGERSLQSIAAANAVPIPSASRASGAAGPSAKPESSPFDEPALAALDPDGIFQDF